MRIPLLLAAAPLFAQVDALLSRPLLDPQQALREVQVYTASRVPAMPSFATRAEWERYAAGLRQRVLDEVIHRGEAVRWRDAKTKVEMHDYFAEGERYRVRKFRYEVIPGLWTAGLIYEPKQLSGKTTAVLNVNGHERTGMSTPYIQQRCMNLASKGVIAVNVEWFGMGQLHTDGFNHYRMPQIDLTGTSGIALFYLAHKRALDITLAHPNTDPARVAVTGLSGGGWQTIFLSALDTRVKAAMPLAGYSSYVTRAQWPRFDLGDSEQTPSDLAGVADYTHLTALMAPRPLLVANNAKDTCCFRAEYAGAPLIQAATPIYRLYGAEDKLGYHINHDDGHNYERDNREAFYRLLRDSFPPGIDAREIDLSKDVRTAEALHVPLPADNLDFRAIAKQLAAAPRKAKVPLEKVLRARDLKVEAFEAGSSQAAGLEARYWKLKMDRAWTVPVVEVSKPGAAGPTVLVLGDEGKKALEAEVRSLAAEGKRVIAIDPFYFGESKIAERDFLFSMLIAGLGERPLGLAASQLVAAARWARTARANSPVTVRAHGPRTGVIAAAAAALDPRAITGVETRDGFASLRDILDRDLTVDKYPELFCFGLLGQYELRGGRLE